MTAPMVLRRPVPALAATRRTASRVAGVAAVLAAATAVTVASHTPGLVRPVRFLAAYSPARLAAGRVWTLPLSALLLGHPKAVGVTSVMFALLFLPYALARGVGRTIVTGMAGHVAATLVIAVAAFPVAVLGDAVATRVVHLPDYGASAFLAACAGGLAVVITRRHRRLGIALLLAVAAFFLVHLLAVPQVGAHVADVEHLVALAVGALVEWRISVLPSPRPVPATSSAPAPA